MRLAFVLTFSILTPLLAFLSYFHTFTWMWLFAPCISLFALGLYEMFQKKRTLLRNYPLLGRLRYVMEILRPKIYQYFVESDTDGTPIPRIYRSVVYQRAKKQLDTTPFGTQLDLYKEGYEWINHSMAPTNPNDISFENLRIMVGGENCRKPYSLSLLNISAMSFGALSPHAISALNWGAKIGNFAHNTGEGSISFYHKKYDGDLIWQIGTGYFGCRSENGNFDPDKFEKKASDDQVKMIELKLSQGAKPGHGGILPASKNTPEIALARGIEPGIEVDSPPAHIAFKRIDGLVDFIQKLRDLSRGKPVGIKFCLGCPEEFEELCKIMLEKNIYPDFISVDGGEGGTGAAPIEFSNSIGMSLNDGLIYVTNSLIRYGIREKIKVLASGKILTGFHLIKAISLGADACYSARAMMLALGCIQALECNKNTCPTGVATQDPNKYEGLVIENKYKRVANFHANTLKSVSEILGATGCTSTQSLSRHSLWRRISPSEIKTYAQIYPYPIKGEALNQSRSS